MLFLTIDELPAFNYFEIVNIDDDELIDLTPLIKTGNPTQEELQYCWQQIHWQILDEFGLTPSAEEQIHIERELFLLSNEYLMTGDRELLNRIKYKQKRLNEIKPVKRRQQSSERTAAVLQASLSIDIDLKKMSICRFFHLIDIHKEKNKQYGEAVRRND
jgi:hypothetical protein